MWVYELKHKPDGIIDMHKGRFVEKDCAQEKASILMRPFLRDAICQPFIAFVHLQLIMVGTHLSWTFKTSFRHGDFCEEVYVSQPINLCRKCWVLVLNTKNYPTLGLYQKLLADREQHQMHLQHHEGSNVNLSPWEWQ